MANKKTPSKSFHTIVFTQPTIYHSCLHSIVTGSLRTRMPSTRHRLTKRSIGLVTLEAPPTTRARRPYLTAAGLLPLLGGLLPPLALPLLRGPAARRASVAAWSSRGEPQPELIDLQSRIEAQAQACVGVHAVESAMAVCYTRGCGAPFGATMFVVQHSQVGDS